MSAKPAADAPRGGPCYQARVTCLLFAATLLAALESTNAAAATNNSIQGARLDSPTAGTVVLMWAGTKSPQLRAKHRGAPALAKVSVATVEGRHWALVRWHAGSATTPDELWAFSMQAENKLVLQWQGSDGPLDADGETRARISLGPTGLQRSYEASWLRRCDGQAGAWRTELLDVGERRFRASARMPWERLEQERAAALTASAEAPLLDGQPWPAQGARAFTFTAASAPTAHEARALPPASVLSDGAADSHWSPFAINTAGAAFATARSSASVAIRGVMVRKKTGSPWPSSLVMHASPEARVVLDPSPARGDTAWFALPRPIASSCLTFDVITLAQAAPVALGEINIVTSLDGAGGVDFAARAVLTATDCGSALRFLVPQLSSTAVAQKLVQGLASASSAGQACALQALATRPPDSVPKPASWLPSLVPTVLGAHDQKGVWKEAALAFWLQGGHPGVGQALLQVVLDETQPVLVRELAARYLATSKQPVERERLLTVAGVNSGATNAIVRAVLTRNLGPLGQSLNDAILAEDVANGGSHAAELLSLRRAAWPKFSEANPPWLASVQTWATTGNTPFALRARALQLLGAVATPAAGTTLSRTCTQDADALVRHLACEALGVAAAVMWNAELKKALLDGLQDPDPRVRQTVAHVWASLPTAKAQASGAALLSAYQKERWPFVLSAQVTAVAKSCIAEQPLVAASTREDLPTDAKGAALTGLSKCKFASAREQALFALKRQTAPVSLRQEAAEVLSVVGKKDDLPTLFRILKQAAVAAPGDPSLDDVAAATAQTMARLDAATGADAALFLLNQTRPRLRNSGMNVLGTVCTAAAQAAIERELAANDAWLASAARSARAACDKQAKPPS